MVANIRRIYPPAQTLISAQLILIHLPRHSSQDICGGIYAAIHSITDQLFIHKTETKYIVAYRRRPEIALRKPPIRNIALSNNRGKYSTMQRQQETESKLITFGPSS